MTKPIIFLPIDKWRNYIGAPYGDTEKQKRRIDAYVGIKWSGQKLPGLKAKNSLQIKKEKRKQEEK